ncbi:MAG: LicD family protein [Bacteroidaceae bacterium]|nr:LicD family protein [Bacteroidaceae bacterium]
MASYDIETLHKHLLKILLTMDSVCREHHIRYYCWAGTMLGAVRHKGFIPWDDDVDICIPRPDYDRLMQHASEWLPQPLEALAVETSQTFPGSFCKIVDTSTTLIEREHSDYVGGIYLDVFPIDGISSNPLMSRLAVTRYKLCDKLLYFLHRDPFKHGHGPSSWFVLLIQKLFSHQWARRQMRAANMAYDYNKSDYVLDYDDGVKGVMRKDILGTPQPVEFEGHTVMGVEHADEYLRQKYGDYMTIPPHDNQRQHNFFFLDYNLPYKQYHDRRAFVSHDNASQ